MAKAIVPVVGMGATHRLGADAYPFHVITVLGPRRIVLSEARVGPNKATWPEQEFDIFPDDNGDEVIATLRKNGSWVKEGDGMRGGRRYDLGEARYYQDPSF